MAKKDFNAGKTTGFKNYADVMQTTTAIMAELGALQQQAQAQAQAAGEDPEQIRAAFAAQKKVIAAISDKLGAVGEKLQASPNMAPEVRGAYLLVIDRVQKNNEVTVKQGEFMMRLMLDELSMPELETAEEIFARLSRRQQQAQKDMMSARRTLLEAIYGLKPGQPGQPGQTAVSGDITMIDLDAACAAVEYEANLQDVMAEVMTAVQLGDNSVAIEAIDCMQRCYQQAEKLLTAAMASRRINGDEKETCRQLMQATTSLYKLVHNSFESLAQGDEQGFVQSLAQLPAIMGSSVQVQARFYRQLSDSIEAQHAAPVAKPRGPKR